MPTGEALEEKGYGSRSGASDNKSLRALPSLAALAVRAFVHDQPLSTCSTPLWTGFTRWGAVHSSLSPTAMAAIARA